MKLFKNVSILCYISQPCSKLPVGMDSKEAPAVQVVMEQCLLLHSNFSDFAIFLAFNDICGNCKHLIKLCILIQIQYYRNFIAQGGVCLEGQKRSEPTDFDVVCLCSSMLSSRTRQSESLLSCGQILETFSSNDVLVLAAFVEQISCQDKAEGSVPLSQSAMLPSVT